jgi:small GTP-binding protein
MRDEESKEFNLKLVILGDPAVGKTSLINKYVEASFKEDYHPTLGVNIIIKDIILENVTNTVRLILWDIAGQDKYELTRNMFFQGSAGAFLVYDKTRLSTFDSIRSKWLKEFRRYGIKYAPFIIIANKLDLHEYHQVPLETGLELSKELGATDFIETSAKSGENVENAFQTLVRRILHNYGENI